MWHVSQLPLVARSFRTHCASSSIVRQFRIYAYPVHAHLARVKQCAQGGRIDVDGVKSFEIACLERWSSTPIFRSISQSALNQDKHHRDRVELMHFSAWSC